MAINLRDSYSKVTWDLGSKKMKAEPWGKTDDTGRGIIVTIAQDSVIVTPTTETLRMSFIKPDGTDGYIPATLEGGKYYIENMSQVFAVPGKVNAELEFNDGTEFIKSISFTIDVYESQQSGNIVSSNDYTALQVEIGKINGFESQLADRATITALQAVASGSPKGAYATLATLQTAYPTGNTNTYVVTADGKWYFWNGSAWTVGGTYQATGIANNGVNSWEISDGKSDILGKVSKTTGYSINASGAVVVHAEIALTDYISLTGVTKFILRNEIIIGGTSYLMSPLFAYYDASKVLISVITGTTIGDYTVNSFDMPANAKYIRVNTDVNNLFYIYIYKAFPEWMDISGHMKANKPINPLTVQQARYNMFGDAKQIQGSFLNADGSLSVNSGLAYTDYIDISTFATLIVRNEFSGGAYSCKGAFYTDAYVFISPIVSTVIGELSIAIPNNAKYARVNIPSRTNTNYAGEYIYPILKQPAWLSITGSKWVGKKAVFLGDSIVEGTTTVGVTKPFVSSLKEYLGLASAINYGIGGTRMTGTSPNNFIARYPAMDNDADLVVVMGGTNDALYPLNGSLLGTSADIGLGNISFYGGLDVLCKGLKNKYPSASVVFMTPLHYYDTNGVPTHGEQVTDKQFEGYVTAIKEVCYLNGIPVIDFRTNTGLNPNFDTIRTTYFKDTWIHLNQLGHDLIAKRIYKHFELY